MRFNIADLLVSNTVSAQRAGGLFTDADEAGAAHVADLAHLEEDDEHVHSKLVRRLLLHSQWPTLYFATTRVWDRKQDREVDAEIPMLLPHEVLAVLTYFQGPTSALFIRTGLDGPGKSHMDEASAKMGPGPPIIPVAFWQDGVYTHGIGTAALRCS